MEAVTQFLGTIMSCANSHPTSPPTDFYVNGTITDRAIQANIQSNPPLANGKAFNSTAGPRTITMVASNPKPTAFVLCSHKTPPTPAPPSSSKPSSCLNCSFSTINTQVMSTREYYDGLINEATLKSKSRAFAVKEDRNFKEILYSGRREIDGLKARKNDEVERLWSPFARMWTGATRVDMNGKQEVLSVVLERGSDGGVECKVMWRYA